MKTYELVIEERQPTCGGKSPTKSRIMTVTTDDPVAYVRTMEPEGALEVFTTDDGTLVKIIDAMPSASFDAIPADTVFLQQEDGSFTAITSVDEDPNIRWYFESSNYGGTEYWRKLEEIAPLGLLLIQSAN